MSPICTDGMGLCACKTASKLGGPEVISPFQAPH